MYLGEVLGTQLRTWWWQGSGNAAALTLCREHKIPLYAWNSFILIEEEKSNGKIRKEGGGRKGKDQLNVYKARCQVPLKLSAPRWVSGGVLVLLTGCQCAEVVIYSLSHSFSRSRGGGSGDLVCQALCSQAAGRPRSGPSCFLENSV